MILKQIRKEGYKILVVWQLDFLKELDKQKPDFRITLKVVKKLVYIKNKIANFVV